MSAPVLAPAVPHRSGARHRSERQVAVVLGDARPGRAAAPARAGAPERAVATADDRLVRRVVVVLAVVAAILAPAAGILTAATAAGGPVGTSQPVPSPSPQSNPPAP